MHSITEKVNFLERIFGRGNLGRTGNLEVWCPLCNDENKKKKKLAIKVDNDFVHCWVCGYRRRSLCDLIKKFGRQADFDLYIKEFIFDRSKLIVLKETPETKKVELPDGFRLLGEFGASTIESRACCHYVTSRGLSESDMWFYKLGYSSDPRWKGRVIVPSFDSDGLLNYFVGRTIYQAAKRYDQPEAHKTGIIFNEINIDWTKELTLCEGPFDLMKCKNLNSTCLLGSELDESYKLFHKIVENQTPICLLLDDDALVKKTLKIAKKLASYDLKVRMGMLPPGKDPGSLTKREIKKIFTDAKEFSWEHLMNIKLAAALDF